MAALGSSSDVEDKRMSMFDVIEDSHRAVGKKGVIHSMVVVAELNGEISHELPAYYEKLFHDIQHQTMSEGATGLLLLFPTLCIHVVEASQEVLMEFVRDLRRNRRLGQEGKIGESKIVVISHNIPRRQYAHYCHAMVDTLLMDSSAYSPTEPEEKLVTDLVLQLLRLACHISKQYDVEFQTTLDSLHVSVPELIPQQALINYLLKSDVQCITPIDEYLQLYEVPYDVHLASDFVWPLPLRILPYN